MVERNVSKLGLRNVVNDKSRDEWLYLIRQWVHNETDRYMLERVYLDGLTYEQLCEEMNDSLQLSQIRKRIKSATSQLFKHIDSN